MCRHDLRATESSGSTATERLVSSDMPDILHHVGYFVASSILMGNALVTLLQSLVSTGIAEGGFQLDRHV